MHTTPALSRRLLVLVTAILLAAMLAPAAIAQPASLAPERFILTRGEHQLKLPYAASHPLTQDNDQIEHLVIMVHGVLRNAELYHRFMDRLWREQADDTLAVLSPQFIAMEEVEEHNLDHTYPYWTRGGWSIGHRSRSDDPHPRAARISSFEMLDELLLQATRRFPSLKHITIAGHSAGGQFVNRYAAGNRFESSLTDITVRYIVANPSSYLYFCENRLTCRDTRQFGILGDNDCAMLNQYRYGLGGNVNAYMRQTGIDQIPDIYASRRVTYLLGEADNDPEGNRLDRSCAALAQGEHRLERGQIYMEYLTFRFGSDIHERHTIATVPGVGHSAARMYGSQPGLAVLFGPRP